MSMHFVDSLAMFARRDAEEMFKLGNIKGAITCASMAKTLDPKVDGIDETILAYKIHQAAMEKDDNGAINWYKVLGIKKGFEDDIESMKMQHNKLVVMLNPTKKDSVATLGAFRLIYNAWRHLSDSNYKNVNLRRKTTPHRNKVTKTTCLRCRKWCKYQVPKISSAHGDRTKRVLLIECSCCKCKFDPISRQIPKSKLPHLQKLL